MIKIILILKIALNLNNLLKTKNSFKIEILMIEIVISQQI